jgi:simple sugar transport system permease protein
VFGFTPVLMWTLFNEGVTSLELAFVIALLIVAVIGFVNGWFVTRLKIPSFLVTLGMLLVVRGTALYVTSGFPQRTWRAEVTSWLTSWWATSTSAPFRLYMSLFWFIGFALILHYVLTQSVRQLDPGRGRQPARPRARGVNVA